MILSQDKKSAFMLARLDALSLRPHTGIIEKVLQQEGDINYAIPTDSHCMVSKPYLVGRTALYFICFMDNIVLFKSLLKRGADFTKTYEDGQTILHQLTRSQLNSKESSDNPFVNAVLSAHVELNNFSNPCNQEGLSHFHVACITNHSRAAQFFLDNGVAIDEPVRINAKVLPGYTALHFAALYTNTKIAELLVAYGANMHVVNAKEMTPLHLLVERRIEMFDSVSDAIYKEGNSYKKIKEQIAENDKIINVLLENMSSDNDSVDNIGLSNFHVACMLRDTSAAQQLADRVTDLDHHVNMNSRLWPGYTALHFAAHMNIGTVKMLISKGANVIAKDLKGVTPLDICIERFKIEDICDIISLDARYKNLLFSDGETTILSLIHALAGQDQFKKYITSSIKSINMRIPMESDLWSGYTPLHLIVLFAQRTKPMFSKGDLDRTTKKEIDMQAIKFCLKSGADLSIQDSQGRTALHLAFRFNKMLAVDAILHHCRQIPHVIDHDNLSHIHIVCATKRRNVLKKCMLSDSAVNTVYKGTSSVNIVRPGSTPLHVCLVNIQHELDIRDKIRILLKNGADPYIKDAHGLTPIHRLLECCSSPYGYEYRREMKQLLAKVANDCVVEEYGLSLLHVACQLNNEQAVKRLIKNGANVNLAIKYPQRNNNDPLLFLSSYDKCTPMHMTNVFTELRKLLIKRGADVFATKANGSPALDRSILFSDYLSKLCKNVDFMKRVRREFGWTRLHLACYLLQVHLTGKERLLCIC